MRPKIPQFLVLLFSLALSLCAQAISISVRQPNGEATVSHVDISVKVLGGAVDIRRVWTNGRWYINPQWADLVHDPQTEIVSRASTHYKRVGDSNIYVFDDNQFIRKINTGWVWYDRLGNTVSYDAAGKSTGYGNRHGVNVHFVRSGGNIVQVLDHLNQNVLQISADGSLITDRLGRTVRYTFNGKLITSATDVRGGTWMYSYDQNGQLISERDPTQRYSTISYYKSYKTEGPNVPPGIGTTGQVPRDFRISKVRTLRNDLNQITTFVFEYDRAKQQYRNAVLTSSNPRRDLQNTYDIKGRLMLARVNDRTVFERRSDGPLVDYFKDERGQVTRVARDTYRNPVSVTYPDGSKYSFTYHPKFSFVTSSIDEAGVKSVFLYDLKGNLTRTLQAADMPLERRTDFTYDPYGQLRTTKIFGLSPEEDATSQYFYDSRGNRARSITPEGHETLFEHDVIGAVTKSTNPLGGKIDYRYEALGNLLEFTTPLGFKTSMSYDLRGRQVSITVPISATENATTTIDYDRAGRPEKTTDPLGKVFRQNHDDEGRILETIDARLVKNLFSYDRHGRLVETEDAAQSKIEYFYGSAQDGLEGLLAKTKFPTYEEQYGYDERGRLVQTKQILPNATYLQRMQYTLRGELASETDGSGSTTLYEYDALGRLSKSTDTELNTTTYEYDTRDNVLSVTRGNQIHRFTYDKSNRETSERSPDGKTTLVEYDANDNIKIRRNPNGDWVRFGYDIDDRLILEERFLNGQTTTAQKRISYTYDRRGLMLSFDDGLTRTQYIYDKKGRRLAETTTFTRGTISFSKTLKRTFEDNDMLKTLEYPDGRIQRYGYNGNNQLENYDLAGTTGSTGRLSYAYQHDALKTVSMPGGLVRSMEHDALLRTTRIKLTADAQAGPQTIMDLGYQFNAVSNVTEKRTQTGTVPAKTEAYNYDGLYRLKGVQRDDQSVFTNELYQFDPMGNRTAAGHQPGPWLHGANNQLESYGQGADKRELDYNANGSLSEEKQGDPLTNTRTFAYDAEERLIDVKLNGVSQVQYAYDAKGQRVWRKDQSGETFYLYSDEGLIGEYNVTGQSVREYGWLPHTAASTDPVWQKDTAGTHLIHTNLSGAPERLTQLGSAQTTWAGQHDAYGRMSVAAGAQTSHALRFPGQWEDPATGFYQNAFRDYNPVTGQYLQADPMGLMGGLNAYGYAGANPVRMMDPLGLWSMDPVWGAIYSATGGRQLPQGFVDSVAGSVDSLTGGLTQWARNKLDIGGVDYCSDAYRWAQLAGSVAGLIGPAGAIRGAAALARLGVSAGRATGVAGANVAARGAAMTGRAGGAARAGVGAERAGAGAARAGAGGQLTANSCGPACGQRVLGSRGTEVFQSNIARGLMAGKGMTTEGLLRNMNRVDGGWKGGAAFLDVKDVVGLASNGSYIVRVGGARGHFVVVESASSKTVRYWDPDGAVLKTMSTEKFAPQVSGVIFK